MPFAEKIETCQFGGLSREQALALIPSTAGQSMDLMSSADQMRRHFHGQRVFTCGIINAKSGLCPENCAFCAQSVHHRSPVEVYPLRSSAELVDYGLGLAEAGAERFGIVTSGTRLKPKEIDTVCRGAEEVRRKTHLKVCVSPGLLDEAAARRLRSAGVTRYHHNIETARSFFDQICTSHDFEEDVAAIQGAKAAGLEICSGGIFGMGETWEQRVEMAFILKDLQVNCLPLNFLNPIAGTRLESRKILPSLEALACIALFRCIHPTQEITICGGREVTLKDLQSWIFYAGANGVMIGNYLTTRGRSIPDDLRMIADLGFSTGLRGR